MPFFSSQVPYFDCELIKLALIVPCTFYIIYLTIAFPKILWGGAGRNGSSTAVSYGNENVNFLKTVKLG